MEVDQVDPRAGRVGVGALVAQEEQALQEQADDLLGAAAAQVVDRIVQPVIVLLLPDRHDQLDADQQEEHRHCIGDIGDVAPQGTVDERRIHAAPPSVLRKTMENSGTGHPLADGIILMACPRMRKSGRPFGRVGPGRIVLCQIKALQLSGSDIWFDERSSPTPMPELPDITIYLEALERRIVGERLDNVRIQAPFLLRTFDPPLDAVFGKSVREIRRLGKRIAIGLDDGLWLVLHLMIAGRLHWKPRGAKLRESTTSPRSISRTGRCCSPRPVRSAGRPSMCFAARTPCRRRTRAGSRSSRRRSTSSGGLAQANHTLKRALSDPHLFSGIGNAYSDEILHRAGCRRWHSRKS